MARPIVLNYPHFRPSYEPRPIRAGEIWQIAETARHQIIGQSRRPKVDIGRVIARARRMEVNGISFQTHWDLSRPVADDAGQPVMGAIEHDESVPDAAMIILNREIIGEYDDLVRSTALHEFGHAVFDTPSWVQRRRHQNRQPRPNDRAPERRFQPLPRVGGEAVKPGRNASRMDWREWRANEFMGAFLAPRNLLHLHMHKRAAALGIPMLAAANDIDLPVVNHRRTGTAAMEELCAELATIFGVSIPFIAVRLKKYGLVHR